MNAHRKGLLLTIAMMLVVTVYAQDFIVKSSTSTIQGTSSLHDWESRITQLDFKGNFVLENNSLKSIKSAEISIPVTGIKSEKGKIMDNKTYDAFKYEKNPLVTFLLVAAHPGPGGDGQVIDASGYLTMAGIMKSIKLNALVKILPGGDLQLTLSKKLKITEFGMEQPTAMMGAITVGDEVTVNFNLVLTPSPNQQAKR